MWSFDTLSVEILFVLVRDFLVVCYEEKKSDPESPSYGLQFEIWFNIKSDSIGIGNDRVERIGPSRDRYSDRVLNYFNYFTEIEDAFVRRRGKHLFLSPLDWALMETWKEQGVPLHIVLRGVEKSFDSFEAKPRKRSVKSLLYCQEEVEAQYQEWLEARAGANVSRDEKVRDGKASNTAFSFEAVNEHLTRCGQLLKDAAAHRRQNTEDDLVEALTRASLLLNEIQIEFASVATFDTRKVEDSLTGLERLLNDAMLSVVSVTELNQNKDLVKAQLRPYRTQMEPAVYEQTLNNLLLKRLRDQFYVPRLSLFYL